HHRHAHCRAGQQMTAQPNLPAAQPPPRGLLNVYSCPCPHIRDDRTARPGFSFLGSPGFPPPHPRDDGAFLEILPSFDHPRSASSNAVISKRPQNANRIGLSGRRLANLTPAEIGAMPPRASGNPTSQSTLPASA